MDIDLAGHVSNELNHIADAVAAICQVKIASEGIEFNHRSIEVSRIKEGAEYEGVRVRFHATLARAKIPLQIDVGFGDVIIPAPVEIEYPALLDFPCPVLHAYSKEAVIAEKLEALTARGLLNSRLKDYYDLAVLSRMYAFQGRTLGQAIKATFNHRKTPISARPVGLSEAFYRDSERVLQWKAFLRRSRFTEEEQHLDRLVKEVSRFALPPLTAAAANKQFDAYWTADGPWQLIS